MMKKTPYFCSVNSWCLPNIKGFVTPINAVSVYHISQYNFIKCQCTEIELSVSGFQYFLVLSYNTSCAALIPISAAGLHVHGRRSLLYRETFPSLILQWFGIFCIIFFPFTHNLPGIYFIKKILDISLSIVYGMGAFHQSLKQL